MILVVEIVLLAATIIFIGMPLFSNKYQDLEFEESDIDDYQKLLSHKDMTLAALKDLEFDYRTGKLSDDDFNELKEQYESEAVEVLEEIDTFNKVKKEKPPQQVKTKQTCPKCNETYVKSDKFCANCGIKL